MRIDSDAVRDSNKSDSTIHPIATSAGFSKEAQPARTGAAQRRFLAETPAANVPPAQEIPGQREYFEAARDFMNARGIMTESMPPMIMLDPATIAQNRILKEAEFKKVLSLIDTAIQKRPGQFLYHKMRAEVLIELKRYSEALPELNNLIESYEDRGQSWETVILPGMPGADGQPTTWASPYKMDWNKADAYWDRYRLYAFTGLKETPEAFSDLQMAAALGNWNAHN